MPACLVPALRMHGRGPPAEAPRRSLCLRPPVAGPARGTFERSTPPGYPSATATTDGHRSTARHILSSTSTPGTTAARKNTVMVNGVNYHNIYYPYTIVVTVSYLIIKSTIRKYTGTGTDLH